MSILTVLILAMTFIMTVAMALRIYWAHLKMDALYADGEARVLRVLQGEQNEWALVHLACGVAVVIMIWLLKEFVPEAPESACAALALYAGTSFMYAVVESMLAHRIDKLCSTMPPQAGIEGQ